MDWLCVQGKEMGSNQVNSSANGDEIDHWLALYDVQVNNGSQMHFVCELEVLQSCLGFDVPFPTA